MKRAKKILTIGCVAASLISVQPMHAERGCLRRIISRYPAASYGIMTFFGGCFLASQKCFTSGSQIDVGCASSSALFGYGFGREVLTLIQNY